MVFMNDDKVIVILNIKRLSKKYDVEVPLYITANDLVKGLNTAFNLGINTENINECFLRCENPIVLLKGNKTLREFNLRNGTLINID